MICKTFFMIAFSPEQLVGWNYTINFLQLMVNNLKNIVRHRSYIMIAWWETKGRT